ncbi:hypothetical protein [Mycetocola lacteus]|uniref:hypothetical protein n=1 Tax=Mycetocola lacteus TaxID=76637 RepID=UPI0011C3C12D|nr:hypothetical protein [Mycetocola lacteus]
MPIQHSFPDDPTDVDGAATPAGAQDGVATAVQARPADTASTPPRRPRTPSTGKKLTFERWARLLWAPVILVLAGFGMSFVVTANHSHALSPIDEWVYVDYLYKLPHQGILQQGEIIGHEALDAMACDGVKPYGPMGPACRGDYSDLSKFPFAARTSADPYTPVYFAITRVVGDTIHAVTGAHELTSWRATGSLWLALTLVLMYWLMRIWRVPKTVAVVLGLAFIGSPYAWWTFTYVSTDAPTMALGTALLVAATYYVRGRGSGWWVVGLSAFALSIKVTNILAVCLIALYLGIVWLDEFIAKRRRGIEPPARRGWFNPLTLALTSIVAAGVVEVAWLVFRHLVSVGDSANQAISVPLTGQELLLQTTTFLSGTITSNVNISGSTNFAYAIPTFAVLPLSWLCIAGVIGAFWALRKTNPARHMIIAVTISAVLFAPMLAIVITLATGAYFPLPPRYGSPMLAAFLMLAGMQIRNRWATILIGTYAVVLYVVVLAAAPVLAR